MLTRGMEQPIRRLGVMGGTFDPIHLGHLVAASEALSEFELDRMLFVPAGHPWQKEEFSDPEDRFLMAMLATAQHPRFACSRMEIDRRGPTYTVDTLRQLKELYGGADLFFVGGADALRLLPTWHAFEQLKGLAEFVVVNRPGFSLADLEATEEWPELHVLHMPPIGISATDIRARVREQRPIEFLVPAEVAAYVREQGLYVGTTETVDG